MGNKSRSSDRPGVDFLAGFVEWKGTQMKKEGF